MILTFHLSIQISFARMRISFLIATIKILEFDIVKTRLFVFENLHFVVFLIVSSVVSCRKFLYESKFNVCEKIFRDCLFFESKREKCIDLIVV